MLFASSHPSISQQLPTSRFFGSKLAVATPSVAPSRLSFSALCNSARAATSRSSSSVKMMATPASFYDVLGIPMGASCQEIKTAYRRLARACHPDVVAIERKETSADEFMKIHAAYSTLLDPEKRVDYDRKLFRRQHRFTSSQNVAASASSSTISRFHGYSRRTWETDQCW